MKESTCKIAFSENGELVIQLAGKRAHFPSTSNTKRIIFRRGKRPFIGHTKGDLGKLDEASWLYKAALAKHKKKFKTPLFETATVLVFLATKKGRWDSHNQCKPIGDWLEKNEIIEDDSNCEILCFKKQDYPSWFIDRLDTTEIIIVPKPAYPFGYGSFLRGYNQLEWIRPT